jgi:hypothetical protein
MTGHFKRRTRECAGFVDARYGYPPLPRGRSRGQAAAGFAAFVLPTTQRFVMKLARLVVIFVGLLFLNGVLAGTASATTVVECRGQLSHLRQDTVAAQPQGRPQKDVSGSIAMLDDASLKLAEGKNADAIQTMNDFVAQGHPSMGVQEVIDCINSIGGP